MPLWTPWSRARTVSTTRTMPRRVVVSAGSPTAQLVESASTMASARSFSPCRSQDRREAVGADLLLALDEDRDTDRQLATVRTQRRDVGHDAGLVVGDAPGVDPAVPLGRLERPGCPSRRRRRAAGRRGGRRAGTVGAPGGPVDVPDDGRAAALADDLDGETLGAQQLGHGRGAGLDVGLVERVERHARDAGERLEVGPDVGQQGPHAVLQGGSSVRGEDVVGHARERTHRHACRGRPSAPSRYPRSARHDIQCGSC